MNLDFWIFQQINSFAGHWAWLDWLGIFFASYFQYALVAFLAVYLFLGKSPEEKKRNRLMAAAGFLAAIISRFIFTTALRVFFDRARPFVTHQVNQLIAYKTTDAFPSGHATFFFALTVGVCLFNKKFFPERGPWISWVLFVGAALISLARIYVGVHYPADILAGALVGIFGGWLVVKIFEKWKPEIFKK